MNRIALCLLLALAPVPKLAPADRAPLAIAAAADLQFVMKELAAEFTRQTGRPVRITFGASGNFAAQIEQGAPFDLFLSADTRYPERLLQAGAAEPGSFYRYATGRLAIYVPRNSPLDLRARGLACLLDPAVKKIAIANPRTAPYGRAALAALEHFGLAQKLAGKLVYGENISQAAQFVASGNAQAGILALALVVAPTMRGGGQFREIPAGSYPALAQAAVIPRGAQHEAAARAFLAFLATKQAQEILRRYGFETGGDTR
jgi:molybdate transport system substrate-binding protein